MQALIAKSTHPHRFAAFLCTWTNRAATNFYPGTIVWARDPNSTFFAPQWLLPEQSLQGGKVAVHERQFARVATEIFETIASQNATASLVPVSGTTNATDRWGSMQLWAGDSRAAMRSQQLQTEREQLAALNASNSSSGIELGSTTNHEGLASVDRRATQGNNADMDLIADQLRRAIEAQAQRGVLPSGSGTSPVCFEATAATQRRRGCTGYQQCGYVCTTESCAAMSTACNGHQPDGRPCSCASCAVPGPEGSVADPRTGRCRARAPALPAAQHGRANGQPAVNPPQLSPLAERMERDVPGRRQARV